MRVLLIEPSMGRTRKKKSKRNLTFMPLTIATLAGMTPNWVKLKFIDDRIENIDYNFPADLVAITVETFTALRAYQIASEFRKRGIPVVLGGFHPTLVPEESIQYADALVIGQSEGIWDMVLEDAKNKKLKKIYQGDKHPIKMSIPNYSIFKGKKYLPITLIEAGRGCVHNCEFCSVSKFFYSKYKTKPDNDFIDEIVKSKKKNFFFVDDNIASDPERLKRLCKKLIPLRISWFGQSSITASSDDDLLYLMSKSGCKSVLIGFESLDKRNLKQIGKYPNLTYEYERAIKKFRSFGIQVYGSFVIGYDFDTLKSADDNVDFAIKQKLSIANFYPLMPFPGTPLYKRLEKEGRLIKPKWWIDPNHNLGDAVFTPKNMSVKELSLKCDNLRKKFYSFKSIFLRSLDNKANSKNMRTRLLFYINNIMTRIENKKRRQTFLGYKNVKLQN